MNSKSTFLLLILLSLQSQLFSRTIYIPQDYQTIQEGIEVALNGDTVLVLMGEYPENLTIIEKSITLISECGAESTIIQGQNGTGLECIATSSLISGFTFTGCWYGMMIETWPDDSLLILNNIFINNSAGIGIGSYDGHGPTIIGNWFEENKPNGAIKNYDTSTNILNNVFFNNSAETGGAIFMVSAVFPSHPVIVNNTIFKNAATVNAGGIFVGWECHAIILNNIIIDNENGGIIVGSEGFPEIGYNDVWRNTGKDYQNCAPGPGDISEDPLFLGYNNFYLQQNSPCIDAGIPDMNFNDPDNTRNDIGACGGPNANKILMVDVFEKENKIFHAKKFMLHQNYPNPFNGSTKVSFDIPDNSFVTAILYDIRGREVDRYINGILNPGHHSIEIASTSLRSGIYILSVQYKSYVEQVKLTVIK